MVAAIAGLKDSGKSQAAYAKEHGVSHQAVADVDPLRRGVQHIQLRTMTR